MAGAVSLRVTGDSDTAMTPARPATSAGALAAQIAELVKPVLPRSVPLPPGYHVVGQGAFSAGVLEKTFGGWREALDAVGTAFRTFRLRRQPDYDVARRSLQGTPPTSGETIQRAAFGLPMEFRFRNTPGKARISLPESDRRGSPLFLTLDRLAGNRLAVVWCLFRARLTPGDRIRVDRSLAQAPGLDVVDEMLSQPFWASHRIA